MTDDRDDVQWTAKAPALIAGIVLVIAGIFSLSRKWKYAALIGVSLLIAGSGFIGWSLTIKDWCVGKDMLPFTDQHGEAIFNCFRHKGWLEF